MVQGFCRKISEVRPEVEKCFLLSFGYQMPAVKDDDLVLYTIDEKTEEISGFLIAHMFLDTAYCSWGAVPEKYKGTAIHLYAAAFAKLKELGCKKATMIVSAKHKKMLMVALRVGYEINGVGIGSNGDFEIHFTKLLGD